MAIGNIHFLFEVEDNATQRLLQAEVEALIIAHRRGEHTPGNVYRACPLCK